MTTIDATDARLEKHEEICALRYENIQLQLKSTNDSMDAQFRGSNARLKRMETIMIASAGSMILGMAGAVFALLTHLK
jgi:hypothetical protein